MDFFNKLVEAFLNEMEVFIEFIPRLLIALIVAWAIYMTGKLVAHAVIRILRRGNMPLVYHSYFTKLIKGIGAFIATIIFLNLIGYGALAASLVAGGRSEEHTSELQSRGHLVCRLLLDSVTS